MLSLCFGLCIVCVYRVDCLDFVVGLICFRLGVGLPLFVWLVIFGLV